MFKSFQHWLQKPVAAAPLAVFRIGFGLMMFLSIVRFWANGWIEKLYLSPTFFFSYRYFSWVKPLGDWTYVLFALTGLAALGVMLGWKYRWSALAFFLGFTYIELMDKTTYLNHYYFISLLAFAMVWLPAARYYSLDGRNKHQSTVPNWTIAALKVFVGVVYFYAGLAKLNTDWLFKAQPLSIWLPSKYDTPLLGSFLHKPWVHYAFSWSGAAYDLLIPFLLLWRPTRSFAFVMVVVFHVLTRVLFPIGMFPYIMIVSALIFFDARVHNRILSLITRLLSKLGGRELSGARPQVQALVDQAMPVSDNNVGHNDISGSRLRVKAGARLSQLVVGLLLLAHLLVPWRYLAYPGELFWTEAGYRFSWRVMLMEKAGYAAFTIVDPSTGKRKTISNGEYLTTFQEKQMATQPDFILEYADYLARLHQTADGRLPAVYVESYVALNGRGSRPYVNPEIDLTTITQDTPRTDWLLPFEDDIYGL